MRAIFTRPKRSAKPPMSTISRPEISEVIETAKFIPAALMKLPFLLMSAMIAGATVPMEAAKSQKVRSANTSPKSNLSLPLKPAGWSTTGAVDIWLPSPKFAFTVLIFMIQLTYGIWFYFPKYVKAATI